MPCYNLDKTTTLFRIRFYYGVHKYTFPCCLITLKQQTNMRMTLTPDNSLSPGDRSESAFALDMWSFHPSEEHRGGICCVLHFTGERASWTIFVSDSGLNKLHINKYIAIHICFFFSAHWLFCWLLFVLKVVFERMGSDADQYLAYKIIKNIVSLPR